MASLRRAAAWALPALNLALLASFFALDVSDFYFKTVWLGPHESYGFQALGRGTFHDSPLVPATNLSAIAVGDEVDFTSGWQSLLAKCDALHATTGSDLFLTVRATGCELGVPAKRFRANDLLLAASARVDAVAWTACKLLYLHRRPPLCQENAVTEFFQRYRLSDPVVTADAVAEAHSDAERELLELLELLSRSYPLSNVVCLEGIQYGGAGEYPASTLVGCASPNVFDAAFVGLHAPAFMALHNDKAFLTVDVLNLMGFEFVIRQNSKSSFRVTTNENDGATTLDHITDVNFSSFGHLYILVVAVDIVLLAAHSRSALETANVLLLPLLGTPNAEDVARLTQEYSWTILYRSLYRSPVIVVLTLLSGLLSWQFQMPNSVIWTWSERTTGKFHAVLASARVWMLVHCLLNQLWGLVVSASEARAYFVAKRTFITTFEILVIGLVVAVVEFKRTFGVSGEKYAIEGQRLADIESFPGRIAFANTFNEELDYLLCTTTAVLRVVYAPMAIIVCEALLIATVYAGVKFVYFSIRHRADRLVDHDGNEESVSSSAEGYRLLPLEELLRVPVRAQSLVRSALPLELTAQQQLYIPPSIYFDFGVILDNDIIRTRRGFFNVIHLKVDVAKYFSPVAGGNKASVASVSSTTAVSTVALRRGSAFFGAADPSSSFIRPPSNATSPLPRPPSGKAMLDAVAATDGVLRPASSSSSSGNSNNNGGDGRDSHGDAAATGRRPLAETAGSPSSRSMRRRKSTTELPSLNDGF